MGSFVSVDKSKFLEVVCNPSLINYLNEGLADPFVMNVLNWGFDCLYQLSDEKSLVKDIEALDRHEQWTQQSSVQY